MAATEQVAYGHRDSTYCFLEIGAAYAVNSRCTYL
jgi:hypothetical protein